MIPGNVGFPRVAAVMVTVLLLSGCGFPFFLLDGGGGDPEPAEIPSEPLPESSAGSIRVLGVASDSGVEDPERAALIDARNSLRAIIEGMRTDDNIAFAQHIESRPEQRRRFNRWLENLSPYRTKTRQGVRVVELRVQERALRERFGIRATN